MSWDEWGQEALGRLFLWMNPFLLPSTTTSQPFEFVPSSTHDGCYYYVLHTNYYYGYAAVGCGMEVREGEPLAKPTTHSLHIPSHIRPTPASISTGAPIHTPPCLFATSIWGGWVVGMNEWKRSKAEPRTSSSSFQTNIIILVVCRCVLLIKDWGLDILKLYFESPFPKCHLK
jgi:hypothetical protein